MKGIGHMERNTGSGTKVSEGGVAGMAIGGGGEIKACGEYVITKIEVRTDKTSGGLYMPKEADKDFIVYDIGPGAEDLGLKVGDKLIVATMTEIPIWDPRNERPEKLSVYHKKQIMGVIRA